MNQAQHPEINTDLWGQDISLSASGQALVAANGELVLTEGAGTGVQDIKLRLFIYEGTLFFDTEFGSRFMDWVLEENTEENRAAFLAEVIMRVEADPRVVPHTVMASVLKWDGNIFMSSVTWQFIEEDQPYNLIMQYNKDIKELTISDAKPKTDSLSAHIS